MQHILTILLILLVMPSWGQDLVHQKLSEMQLGEYTLSQSAMPHLYEVIYTGGVMYIDKEARFIFDGKLIDAVAGVDLTEKAIKKVRVNAFKELKGNFISYGRRNAPHRVVVFTDIDCGYCRRLHNNMDAMIQKGIAVDYILTPFRGEASYKKSISVWCSKDKKTLLTTAKRGQSIPSATCIHPIGENLKYAEQLKIRGTPAIFSSSGAYLGGYLDPDKLLKLVSGS